MKYGSYNRMIAIGLNPFEIRASFQSRAMRFRFINNDIYGVVPAFAFCHGVTSHDAPLGRYASSLDTYYRHLRHVTVSPVHPVSVGVWLL